MSNMKETWKDVVDYEGLYRVSNKGRVKTVSRMSVQGNRTKPLISAIKAVHLTNSGYYSISLYKGGKGRRFLVHRLVALAFLEKPEKMNLVHHIDHNKTNNALVNLSWTDKTNNAKDAVIFGAIKSAEKHHNSKLSNDIVLNIYNRLIVGDGTVTSISKELSIPRTTISAIKHGWCWSSVTGAKKRYKKTK